MRYVKALAPLLIAAIALVALAGASSAAATVLCKNNLNTETCSERYKAGTEFKTTLVTGTKATLETEFLTVECAKASGEGKLGREGSSTATPSGEGTGTYGECNCVVTVLNTGTIEVHQIAGTDNGTVTFNGSEVTTVCSTIFGNIHCIFATQNTDMGTLESGSTAYANFQKASIPRLVTNSLCSPKANLTAKFEITTPKPLYVAAS